MKKLIILLFLLIPAFVWAGGVCMMGGGVESGGVSGNDFSSDANCVCLYNFEGNWTGGTLSDDKASVDLTAYGDGTPAYPDKSATYKEGLYSADFEYADKEYFGCLDSVLPAAFPGKTSYPDVSVAFWFKPESSSNSFLCGKWCYSTNERSWSISYDANNIVFNLGHNEGASYTSKSHHGVLVNGQWYHVSMVYDNDGGADLKGNIKIRIYDDTAGTILQSESHDIINSDLGYQMACDTGDFGVGTIFMDEVTVEYYPMDGLFDEFVLFKDILTISEMDKIRLGTY